MILRSFEWDGPGPAPGDVVRHPDGLYTVVEVAAGAGIGHWMLVCEPARIIEWVKQTH